MKEYILRHTLLNAMQYNGKADQKAVIGKILSEMPELKKNLKEIIQEVEKAVKEINSWSLKKQKEKIDELGLKLEKKHEEKHELPPLLNVGKKVVMRMAPFPSGPLHIGNLRMVILNDEYVNRYKGELILVVDDTIGSEDKIPIKEAYKMVEDGLRWLGVKWSKTIYKSDRLEIFYEYAEKLIKAGHAYVCECPVEKLRGNRKRGIECECRKQDEKTNLEKWNDMLTGKYKEGKATLRLKTDMKHENPAFRDRVLLRISERKHPRVGNKYRVWPMLEYSWAIDDHLLAVTHILRGKDLIIEDMMEKHIWNLFGWKGAVFLHYGLLSLEGFKLSKSKARKAIAEKTFTGWSDPRTWSLQSLQKRGIKPEAIRNFLLSFGMSMNDITVPDEVLYSENRKIIEPLANRYFCVIDPVEIKVLNTPPTDIAEEPLHPDFPGRGKRKIVVNTNKIYVSKGDFEKFKGKPIRLIGLFNIKLDKKSEFISKDVLAEMQKIQWVSEKHLPIKIIMPDGNRLRGISEENVKQLKVDDILQFVRIGFCRLDAKAPEMIFHFAHK